MNDWSQSFDAWWEENRIATHKIKGSEGFARKAFHAGFQTAVSSVGVEQPASIGQVAGSSPARQANGVIIALANDYAAAVYNFMHDQTEETHAAVTSALGAILNALGNPEDPVAALKAVRNQLRKVRAHIDAAEKACEAQSSQKQ